jgi:hypothetical protein
MKWNPPIAVWDEARALAKINKATTDSKKYADV